MKSFVILSSVVLLSFSIPSFAQHATPPAPREDVAARQKFEYEMLANPVTGKIPANMRERELRYAATLPSVEGEYTAEKGTSEALSTPPVDWQPRGPQNIGGRTLALGIDVANENIILAGGTTGGMWRSTDNGNSWVRTTPLNQIDDISTLAQDTRPGKTNIWYCATGEPITSSADDWNAVYNFNYFGNGIFKSTDDGRTWHILPSTVAMDSVTLSQPFNWVNRIVVDRSNTSQDILYAATIGGIERSSDGGKSWTMTLGSYANGSGATDVAISSTGIVYAVLAEVQAEYKGFAPTYGVYRSTDGIHWTNITPPSWEPQSFLVYLAIAPSDENVVYCSSVSDDYYTLGNYPSPYFWKYTYLSGDGSGAGGNWDDRSASVQNINIQTWAGITIHVHPNDANTVYLGGIDLWRSTDGFATSDYSVPLNKYEGQDDLHVDQWAMAFYPSNSSRMIVGCDGGVYSTDDDLADQVLWTSLDNNFVTTQFFGIGVDHYVSGSTTLLGGLQDNGSIMSGTDSEEDPWTNVNGGDGEACAIVSEDDPFITFVTSSQWGETYEESYDGSTFMWDRIDPVGGTGYSWTNPLALDPNNSDVIYFGGGRRLWRNDDLSSIPLNEDNTPTSVGWQSLSRTQLPANSPYGATSRITAIAVSTNPPNRVYYGTDDGMFFRLDNANNNNSSPVPVWSGKGFPSQALVNSIAVDPNNADSVIIAFANFEVQSLFLTTNGGTTWQPIGGNLEEHPNGSGNGPSVRAAAILPTPTGNVYLVGTSTGVYSTNKLSGMQTVWSLEGASVIGNDIINALDVRPSDGYVAVGSCGSGAFTATITSATGAVRGSENAPTVLTLEPNYPNPYSSITHFEFKVAQAGNVSFGIYDTKGVLVKQLVSKPVEAGTYTTEWNSSLAPSGVYIAKLSENGNTVSRAISLER